MVFFKGEKKVKVNLSLLLSNNLNKYLVLDLLRIMYLKGS